MSRRRRSTNPPPSYISSTNDDDWYSIKAILDERKTKFGKLEYLVDWEGLNPETGEPYEPWWHRALTELAATTLAATVFATTALATTTLAASKLTPPPSFIPADPETKPQQ
ncbi:unnamed protein product [Parascedosporium putredinis]|uniref:Chromo domain-containing protein n=1 Tax=Parascedosporium putredinis TaxID=1442378 RepID=A0A9P1H0P3_9PEZI|nr:unnamed protein product [Parascedosporium putredinis]CAI7992902.1 unnamed protein product [Parascedosporium putredinis]